LKILAGKPADFRRQRLKAITKAFLCRGLH
jgi:hypothetical protein